MPDPIFIATALATIVAAVLALEARQLVYGAVGLALMFVGVAGLFALLDAPFLAMFQIFINVGAVAVLILFTVMLVSTEKWAHIPTGRGIWPALSAGVVAAVLVGIIAIRAGLDQVTAIPAPPAAGREIGALLLGHYAPALEVAGLLIAAALMAAITLAKVER